MSGSSPYGAPWSAEDDDHLLDQREAGASFSMIAGQLGRTKSVCAYRFRMLQRSERPGGVFEDVRLGCVTLHTAMLDHFDGLEVVNDVMHIWLKMSMVYGSYQM